MLATTSLSFNKNDKRPIKVHFQDEVRFGRISIPVRSWAPKGIRPIISKQTIRQYIYSYSSVCPEDGDCYSLLLPECNTEMMKIFLDHFSEHNNEPEAHKRLQEYHNYG